MLKHRFKLFLLLFCFFVMQSQAEMNIKQFADHDQYADVKISPTGKYLALAQYAKGKLELLIITRDKRELVNKIAFSGNDEVGDFYWVNDERLVMKIFAKSYFREFPAYYGELFSIDAEKPQGKLIFGSRILQGTPKKSRDRKIQSMHKAMASSWANIVDLLPGDTKHILISARPYSKKKNKLSRLYKLNVYDASIQFVTEAPLPDTKILTNKKGELVFAVGTDKEDNKAVFDYDKKNNSWIKNKRIEHGRVFHPLVYKEKSTDLIVIDNFNTDTRSLYSINLTTGKRVLLFSDPNNDINWVHLSEDERHVYGLTTQPAYLEYHFPNIDSEEAVLKNLIAKFKGYRVNITSNTKNLNQYVFSVTSDVEPGAWFLFNREKNSIDFLLKRNDRIESDKMRSMYAFNFSARDGVKLSGYLTLPSGEKKNNLPAVMLVHSGPFGVRDNWGYNHEVQLLSAKGYAVIQVNYRGSTGYGYQFESAGYTHWGDKIQFDILDSVKYLSEQSIIDPKRICIMGTYFGGYSAVQASILAPRQFVCAIATSGVYDLKEMYDEDSINDYIWGKTFLKKTLGHIPSMLKNFSPINHVEQLETPLLLVHGEKDMKNPLSQAKALKKKLEQFKKSYQWLELNGDGHGFYNEKNRLNYYQQVLKFLDQHNPVAN